MAISVKFSSAALGVLSNPMGLDGPGTMDWNDTALTLVGPVQPKAAPNLIGCASFFVVMVVVIMLGVAVKQPPQVAGSCGGLMAFVGLIAGALIGRRFFPKRDVTVVIPWDQLGKLRLEIGRIVLVSKVKPKGEVTIDAEKTPLVFKELHAFALSRGAKV